MIIYYILLLLKICLLFFTCFNYNMNTEIEKNPHPISVHNKQCIGPCYYSGSKIIHPISLREIYNIPHNFCPVDAFIYNDPKTGKDEIMQYDTCYIPTAKETQLDEILINNIISPKINFSAEYFVKIYYNINSLEDMIRWLDENKDKSYSTKIRIFNNSMIVYGNHLNIVDHRIANFVNEIMLHSLPKLYRYLKNYFKIKNNNVIIVPFSESDVIHNTKHIKYIRQFIKDKFLGIDNMHQFMSKFIRYYKNQITDTQISDNLVNHMIDYIKKRINLTFEK